METTGDPVALARELAIRTSSAGIDVVDVVPGAVTVLAVAARSGDVDRLGQMAAGLARTPLPPPAGRSVDGVTVEVPVVYDGADLGAIATATGMAVGDVVSAHAGGVYRAAFGGFAPGFSYLEGLAPELRLPRRAIPRPVVPAGSVAVADRYSAVYPGASPGGWHLLGRTDLAVWDPDRRPPALLGPGTRVRFVPVDRLPGGSLHDAGPLSGPGPGSTDTFEVLDPGVMTVVEDAGRAGHAAAGVAPSGWLDAPSATLANRLVGNGAGEAVLETTLRGPRLRLRTAGGAGRAVAVTGAVADVRVDGRPVGWAVPVEVPAGAVVEVGTARVGARSYLAVAGGVTTPPTLASRSTDVLGRLGPPPLSAGDAVPLGPDHGRRRGLDAVPVRPPPADPVLRVHPGPRLDRFSPSALASLVSASWRVDPQSNRVGLRLSGPPLDRLVHDELPPEGAVTGSLQVPPSGQPMLFLADHPVTGGYPVIAVVDDADLPAAGQLPPGAVVRFAVASPRA